MRSTTRLGICSFFHSENHSCPCLLEHENCLVCFLIRFHASVTTTTIHVVVEQSIANLATPVSLSSNVTLLGPSVRPADATQCLFRSLYGQHVTSCSSTSLDGCGIGWAGQQGETELSPATIETSPNPTPGTIIHSTFFQQSMKNASHSKSYAPLSRRYR